MLQISYYDQLFGDQSGSQRYLDWLHSFTTSAGSVLEMACGTGDLLSLLAKNHEVSGFDLDPKMVKTAKEKYPELAENIYLDDFLKPKTIKKVDALVCVNDSLNYILNLSDLKRFVNESIKFADELFLDSHHPYRLIEFEDGYLEEGSKNDFDYSYQISCQEDYLIHIINFLNGTFDSVFQWVFDPEILIHLYKEKGYRVDVFTDFDQPGILAQGEKVMYHVYKEESL